MLVFLIAVVARFGFHYWTLFLADDAFITFRYASNIAHGLGFVYNSGERVLGTSTPLFTFLLSALSLTSIPIPTLAVMISVVASGVTAVIVYLFALRLRLVDWAVVPALAYALWPRSLPADSGGMETALFTLLITAAFYYSHRRFGVYAVGMATLATLTRPEGALLLLLLLVHESRRDPPMWKANLLTILTLLIPWLVFSTWYFGSPLPHSVTAKLALYSRFGSTTVLDNVVYLLALKSPVGWILTIAAVIGWRWLSRTQCWGSLAAVWLLAMIAFYALSGTHLFFWYVAPLYPVVLLFAGGCLQFASERLSWLRSSRRGWVHTSVILGLAVTLLAGSYSTARSYRDMQATLDSVHRQIGLYLNRAVEDGQTVAAEDIGYIGFYSGKPILDRDGLVSPSAVAYNRAGDYAGLIRDFRPEWIVAMIGSPISGFIHDTAFLSMYTQEQEYSSVSSGAPVTYVIFKRSVAPSQN